MHLVRIGFPAAIGLLLVSWGWTVIADSFGSRPDRSIGILEAVAFGIVPVGLGIAFLIAAFAIARLARSGYGLGLAAALLVTLALIAFIVTELGYLDDVGIGGALAGPLIAIAALLTLIPVGYGLALRRSRGLFAATWTALDRSIGVALVVVAAATLTISLAGRATGATANADTEADAARAQALVAAATLEARVVDVSLVTSATGLPEAVRRLTLRLVLDSPEPFDLASQPTLCLTDLATFRDDAYKPGTVCWGGPGEAILLAGPGVAATITEGTNQYEIQLDDRTTACALGPGTWLAELRLMPRLGASPLNESYSVTAEFEVPAGSSSPLPAAGTSRPAGAACMESSP